MVVMVQYGRSARLLNNINRELLVEESADAGSFSFLIIQARSTTNKTRAWYEVVDDVAHAGSSIDPHVVLRTAEPVSPAKSALERIMCAVG